MTSVTAAAMDVTSIALLNESANLLHFVQKSYLIYRGYYACVALLSSKAVQMTISFTGKLDSEMSRVSTMDQNESGTAHLTRKALKTSQESLPKEFGL